MKKLMITSIILALLAMGTSVMAQATQEDYLGLPGDNLDLFAVMKLFQESETLEGFEKSLNEENSKINNLDLNADKMVDYIKVMDNIKGNVHTIVLQVAVDEMENQDVAVFTVQRLDDGQVYIQLTGDEELYGKNYIIEPIFDNATPGQTPNPGYTGNNSSNSNQELTFVTTTTYEVAAWPVVRYIYLPEYIGWSSSWYYGYYPPYWHPWRPYYWHYYHGYQQNWYGDYRRHYRHWDSHRYQAYNDFYYIGHRTYSSRVGSGIREGHFKETYSHPEQRKDGEELYRRSYSEKSNRNGERASDNNTNRRSASQTDQTKTTTRTTTNKRRSASSSTPLNNRAGTKRPTEKSSSATKTRRSTSKSSDRRTEASGRRSSTTSKSGTTEKRAAKQSSKDAAATTSTKKETKRR